MRIEYFPEHMRASGARHVFEAKYPLPDGTRLGFVATLDKGVRPPVLSGHLVAESADFGAATSVPPESIDVVMEAFLGFVGRLADVEPGLVIRFD